MTAGLVVSVGNTFQFAFLHEVGNVFDKLLLVDAVGNLRNDNLIVVLAAFNLSLCAHHDLSASRLIGILHALQAVDEGTRREVRRRDILHQSFGINVGVVDIGAAAVDDLSEVMCRHIGGHTHGNTVTSIHQQVGHLRRHHGWLLERIVEVVGHIHGVFLQIVHDVLTHLREAALGVSHGSR